ncbi:MAG: ABC transporter ATP-binding protein [Paludibaculum sp.]
MTTICVQVEEVWKTYGNTAALRGLSLSVPAQSVYGFLGPNGAGKSTTIRMILGLQRPDRGRILLFGQPLEPHRTALLARIGSLVEAPSLYGHLTGRENLEVHRRLLNGPRQAIDRVLSTVDLAPAADRAVRGYSSGMKQRLGLAQALLGDPELLLLDEPTNGLDPAGIQEVRTLIQHLPKRSGVTVFVSSHLLAEVEQVATHFAILSAGQSRFEGTAEDLRLRSKPWLEAEVDDRERALAVLARASIDVLPADARQLRIRPGIHEPAVINAMLVQSGIAVSHLAMKYPTLEEAFLELTSAAQTEREAVPAYGA